jgi:hypothetical protein
MSVRFSRAATGTPVLSEYRPHHVIAHLITATKCGAKDALSGRAQLPQNAISAEVRLCRAGLKAEHAEVSEGGIEEQAGAAHEQPSSPIPVAQYEAPFGNGEIALDRPDLDDSHGSGFARWDDAVTRMPALAALDVRPPDEAAEAVHRRRTRRDVLEHSRLIQMREERRRVTHSKLAKDDSTVAQLGQAAPPVTPSFGERRRSIGQTLMDCQDVLVP